MRSRTPWRLLLITMSTALLSSAPANALLAGTASVSHTTPASPPSNPPTTDPQITLLSALFNNDGSNLIITLTFANPTIEGPSAGASDSIWGFINLDTDKTSATGATGLALDNGGYEPGFGQFTPSSLGIDAYINLSSEALTFPPPFGHGAPGLVDLVQVTGSGASLSTSVIDTLAVTYTNKSGGTPSTLTLSVPLSDFSGNGIPISDTGYFSAVVGNQNNATDVLNFTGTAAVPETVVAVARRHRRARRNRQPGLSPLENRSHEQVMAFRTATTHHSSISIRGRKNGGRCPPYEKFKSMMITPSDAYTTGLAHYQAGRLSEAERTLRGALAADAEDAEAWNLLGAACFQLGKVDEAQACYERALKLRPDHAETHNNLGVALVSQGRFVEAIARFEQSLRCRPEFREAQNNLYNARRDSQAKRSRSANTNTTDRPAAAAAPSPPRRVSVTAGPPSQPLDLTSTFSSHDIHAGLDPFETLIRQGVALAEKGQFAEGAERLRQASQLRPEVPGPHNDLGIALAGLERYDEAEACFRRALALRPDYPEALNNLGNVLNQAKRSEEALTCYERAVALRPDYIDALRNQGIALKDLGRFDESVKVLEDVLRRMPDDPTALNNLGVTLGQRASRRGS